MKQHVRSSPSRSMSPRQRKRAIRDAIRRRRVAAPRTPSVHEPSAGPVTAGSTITFYDARGRFATGKVLDDESFRVLESNLVSPWTVLYKSPYMSWEESLRVVGGSTLIKPRDLLGFTRMLVDDPELEDVENDSDDSESEDEDVYRRGA